MALYSWTAQSHMHTRRFVLSSSVCVLRIWQCCGWMNTLVVGVSRLSPKSTRGLSRSVSNGWHRQVFAPIFSCVLLFHSIRIRMRVTSIRTIKCMRVVGGEVKPIVGCRVSWISACKQTRTNNKYILTLLCFFLCVGGMILPLGRGRMRQGYV